MCETMMMGNRGERKVGDTEGNGVQSIAGPLRR